MILDANALEDGTALQADLCIVGGGVAGIAVALRLAGAGCSILLLESGGLQAEPETDALSRGEVADERLHAAPDKYRRRGLGGASAIWGGRCVPFDPIDFERRPWIERSGWPFGFETLLPYYEAASPFCEAGRFAYTADAASRAPLAGFRGPRFRDDTLERFSCPTDFGHRYRARLQAQDGLRVLLHANATEIHTDPATGTVVGLSVRTLRGRAFTASARLYVLATGGLETPRLLLASRDHHAAGVGNAEGWVGRSYMCHIAGTLGALRVRDPAGAFHGYERAADGAYCRRRFTPTPATQEVLSIGNFVARLHHPRIPDPAHRTGALSALFLAKPFISFEYSKRLHGEGPVPAATWAAHAANVAADPFGTAGFLLHWLRRRTLATRKFPTVIVRPRSGVYSLDFNAEQAPNPASRITLGGERDRLGMPQLRVDWRHSPGDLRTVREAFRALAADLRESGIGRLDYDEQETDVAALQDGAYGGHHIGTARMAASPQDGVVDADLRVHGVRNLFVAGSAAFPTSGQANPTLTIVALALRLGDRLRRELQSVPGAAPQRRSSLTLA